MTATEQSPEASGPIDAKFVSLLLASPDDAAEISGLHVETFNPAWDENSVKSLLENPGACAMIAKVRDPAQPNAFGQPPLPAGFILGQVAADQAEVISMAVTTPYQRKGLGGMLVDAMLRVLGQAEVKRLFLDVAEDNEAARALYAQFNFEEVSRREAYYKRLDRPSVDALVLSREV